MEAVHIGNIKIPIIQGETGPQGLAGKIKEVRIKKLDILAEPTVENLGTENEAIIEIGIPQNDNLNNAKVNDKGNLILILDSTLEIDVGTVVGKGIANIIIEKGILRFELTDGSVINAGSVYDDEITNEQINKIIASANEKLQEIDTNSQEIDTKYNTYIEDMNSVESNVSNIQANVEKIKENVSNSEANIEEINKQINNKISSKLSREIVDTLPDIGEFNKIYLILKEKSDVNNIYDEYMYVNGSWEKIGDTKVDLTHYIKDSDYANNNEAGIIKADSSNNFGVNTEGTPYAIPKTLDEYEMLDNSAFIGKQTLENIKNDYIKRGITNNSINLTDEEKIAIQNWLGVKEKIDEINSNIGNINTVLDNINSEVTINGI